MSDLLNRLNIIQDAITLGEDDIIALQAERLPSAMRGLAELLVAQKYADAALWILDYRKNNMMLTEYKDAELAGLQMELAQLEAALTELVIEKSECLRKIAEFNAAYMENLGELLEKILQIRLQQAEARTTPEADEDLKKARREYEDFTQQKADTPQTQPLDDEQKRELKKLFKQAAHKCHPDRLPDDKKEAGEKMFQKLEAAHREQDLTRVREIVQKLQSGDWIAGSETLADKDILRQRIVLSRERIAAMRTEINAIHEDDTWQLLASLATEGGAEKDKWEVYFSETKITLEKKLAEMEKQA
ncbi:hypothetical protein [Candidatus Spongiihabitans sp.]|uniref:hypothetical protein n=1 Tax=Candidatus Spongiihabitans sp. TaxID=3101308 RepID=UPI003C6FAC4D